MAIKIKSLDSIEVELGHIVNIVSDGYGNKSSNYSTFKIQLPNTSEKDIGMSLFDSQTKCPYCQEVIKIRLSKTKMKLIPAVEENRSALKIIKRKKVFLITFIVFVLIEIFYWWFLYAFSGGEFGSSSKILINIYINIVILTLVFTIIWYSTFNALKYSLKHKQNLLIPAKSCKKIRKSLGDFNIITQVDLGLKSTLYNGDHFIVGEYVSGKLSDNKIKTGHEFERMKHINMNEYSSFIDTMNLNQ